MSNYRLWFLLLVEALSLASLCAKPRTRKKQIEWTEPCYDPCDKGCNYNNRTHASLKVVCQSLNCRCIPHSIQLQVTSLILTGNNLTVIRAGAFRTLTNLAVLDLRANEIHSFETGALHGQVRLKRLDLSDNPVHSFPRELFRPLRNLEELHLSRTASSPSWDSNWLVLLKNLRNLSYTHNKLLKIPSFTSRQAKSLTPKLTELHLEDNIIDKIYSTQLEGLGSLEKLFLCRNSITYIENGAFYPLNKLKYLYLDGNRQVRLDDQSLLSNSIEFMNLADTGLFLKRQHPSNNPLNINNSISSFDLSGTNLDAHQLSKFVKYYEGMRSLNVNKNNIDILTSETFKKLSSLEELQVANNSLTHISNSSLPPKLWRQLKTLDLSGNPFRCDCSLFNFCQWIKTESFSYSGKLLNGMQCVGLNGVKKKPCLDRGMENILKMECLVKENDWFLRVLTATVFVISFSSTFGSIAHRFRWNIRYWIFTHKIQTKRFKQVRDKKRYTYDAFISYSETDSKWVIHQLLPRLESEYHLRLCIHQRDWLAGRDIAENIVISIEQSRKTVLIVSNAFAVSQWCHFEMTMAQSRVFQDDRDNLVLVMLEEIPDCNMSPRLRMLTERQTYVQWDDHALGQQLFWVKLQQALAKPAESVTGTLPPLDAFIE